ncbi:ZrgA family zinc uptake protein [Leucothrix arctica]|uniref:DUF2796 domain-containing protein n=1 Tax=Leucothrix arctica TaxID=1481894 RepID=A0A317C4C0_9GAMM|nr:DUF2796 domain-containing protein [Leucothrix arctica]PWQ93129.1 hypothetical protein DKT75_20790 [Leucothrix arctica]
MNSTILKAKKTFVVSLLAASAFSFSAFAETQKAHEHGAARLTIATNDEGFEVTLETPAANVFGFEYKPTSKDDLATVEKVEATLKNGDMLFAANSAAGCKFHEASIESALLEDHDEHHDEKHEGHKDEHAEKHDDHKDHHDDEKHEDHKDEHAEKHDDHEEHKSAHSDVDATWHFDCDKVSTLEKVDVKLFTAFPKGFTDLDVDWISASKSGHVELESDGSVTLK